MATHLLGKKLKIQQSTIPQCIAIVQSIESKRLASSGVRRGTGGRSSFSGIVATVFGCTGFTGRYIVNRLGRIGSQIIAPTRCTEQDSCHLRVMGDLGQIIFRPLSLRDQDSMAKAVKYSNIVINLIGRDYETRNYSFEDVHVTAAQTIARLCKDAGVKRLIHFSALGANKDSPSKFLQYKAAGEEVVKEAFPNATIIRPAAIYGHEDRYFNYYAGFSDIPFNRMVPIMGYGFNTYKYPVFMSDVASGVINAVHDPSTAGTTFEFLGPKRYSLYDLVQYMYAVMYRRMRIVNPPAFLQRLTARVLEMSPFEPHMTRDLLIRLNTTEEGSKLPGLEDVGVIPTTVEDNALIILRRYRNYLTNFKTVDDVKADIE